MTIEELNEQNIPIVRIDASLEQYKDAPLFQDKVDKANEALRTIGLPQEKKYYSKKNDAA